MIMRAMMTLVEHMLDETNAGDEHVYTVPVADLRMLYDPFETSPWLGIEAIDPDDVATAIEHEDFSADPCQSNEQSMAFHVSRIAYLVVHPDSNPIDVVPTNVGSFTLEDGFHRLAAAIYRGDQTIKVAFGGTRRQLNMWLRSHE
jgi:hypothetical protein